MSLCGGIQSTEKLRCVYWLLAEMEIVPEWSDQGGRLNADLILQDS